MIFSYLVRLMHLIRGFKFGAVEWLVLTVISALFVSSYFIFSADHFQFLNSDMAIHALMARAFEFHHGLFYWGQNRLGSLLPLAGFFPWKLLGVNPLLSISVAQYGMVAICIMLFHALMLRPLLTLLFSVFLLFPSAAYHLIIMPGHPYLPHLMLTLAAIWTIRQTRCRFSTVDVALHLTFAVLALISVWVTDMALVTVPIILFWRTLGLPASDKKGIRNPRLLFGSAGLISIPVLLAFAHLLKRFAVDYSGYHLHVADTNQVISCLRMHGSMILKSVQLHDIHFWSDAYTVLLAVCIFSVIAYLPVLSSAQRKTAVLSLPGLFVLLAFATWSATLFSGWAAISDYPHRYFCLSFIFLIIGLIAFTSAIDRKVFSSALIFILLIAALLGAASYTELKPKEHRFKVDAKARLRLEAMRSSTIVGDYWYCYVMAAYNADQIIPIATDGQFLRNGYQMRAAFMSDSIFVCADPISGNFPDTAMQYGNLLLPSDEPGFRVGNAQLKRYVIPEDVPASQ